VTSHDSPIEVTAVSGPASAEAAPLPIDPLLPRIVDVLGETGTAVIEAPTGAGKTTRVPLALLEAGWTNGGRIVVLEPRRVAARAAARRMAAIIGEEVGRTVGYVTRHDRATCDATRIEVVTEGIVVRRFQRDPSLAGTSTVLFDEFHERSLAADLGLAFALDAREALRPDLRIGVMSATLDGVRIGGLIGGAPVVRSAGRSHPVTVRWRPRRRRTDPVEPDVIDAVRDVIDAGTEGPGQRAPDECRDAATDGRYAHSRARPDEDAGDVLVFLPGAGEIRRVAHGLAEAGIADRPDIAVTPLYGALPPDEQDRAIDPGPPGVRKVVLATDIAETSLTIPGVRTVVDAGMSREPRSDPSTGMSRLVTVPVSRAGAEQRAGRAGRTAPGVCVRLWSEAEHHALDAFRRPEIAQTDLAGFALEAAAWGVTDPGELRMLDAVPDAPYRRAVALLTTLGALDEVGRITEHGQRLAELPLHPRLGQIVLLGRELGLGATACAVAALLSDRDPVRTSPGVSHVDIVTRLELLERTWPVPEGMRVRGGALGRVRRERDRLRHLAGVRYRQVQPERAGLVLAFGYPDRIAQRREGAVGEARGSFLLSNGRGATVPDDDPMADEDLLVVADVDAGDREARIHLAAPVTADDLELALGEEVEDREIIAWDPAGEVVAERHRLLGALVLRRSSLAAPDPAALRDAIVEGVRTGGLELLPWTSAARELRDRLDFLRRTFGSAWPDVSDGALLADLDRWLGPHVLGMRRRGDLRGLDLVGVLRALLRHDQHAALDGLAPTHLEVPSGSRVRVDYTSREVPVLPVRVQEMFGATRTPTVAGGRVRVLLRLLSPAQRAVQVTDDLAGFWERTYPQVRAELRGRYPKHAWPEDPLRATPTRGAKRRGGG
jgi:ATP-dependent helicase HrpB